MKYLDLTGLGVYTNKVKSAISTAQTAAVTSAESYADGLKNTIDNYTINGKKISTNPTISLDFIPTSEKGTANGVATLDANKMIPLSQLGNLDTTLFVILSDSEELPNNTANISKSKFYLKKSDSTSDSNVYAEYIYTGDLSSAYDASKWEKLGEYKASTDLSDYYNKSTVDTKIDAVDKKVTTIQSYINTTLADINKLTFDKKFDTISGTADSGQNVVTSVTKGDTNGTIKVTYGTALTTHQSLDGYVNNLTYTLSSEVGRNFNLVNNITKSGKTIAATYIQVSAVSDDEIAALF